MNKCESVLVVPDGHPFRNHFDTLNGRPLREGDIVNVFFPDGTRLDNTVIHIDKRQTGDIVDTAVYYADDSRAYIIFEMNGIKDTRLYLRWKPAVKVQFAE